MTVELISVGTEILMGNIVNTNAAYLSEKCAQLGMSLYHQSVVGDNEARLSDQIRTSMERSDIVILTGGLGPTQDDLTKETAAAVLGKKLVEDAAAKEQIRLFFEQRKVKEVPENNWKQALVPEGSNVIANDNGTAPGIIMEENGKCCILLPGPPAELIPMFEDKIYPYLKQKCPDTIYSVMVKTCGLSESEVAEKLEKLIRKQTNPTIATYAKTGEVHLRITAKASDEKVAKKLVKPVVKEITGILGDAVYTTDDTVTLEAAILELLKKKELELTTAEALTGGLLSARLTNVPGASEVFRQGFITYSNRAKRKMLDVKKSTLKDYGSVSEKTAKEMAKNGAFMTGADICIALTGNAGPEEDVDQNVGLVYTACSYKNKVSVREHHFTGNRQKIREASVVQALVLLRDCLLADKD